MYYTAAGSTMACTATAASLAWSVWYDRCMLFLQYVLSASVGHYEEGYEDLVGSYVTTGNV